MKNDEEISRREFLKGLGITSAAVALFGSAFAAAAGDFITEETAGGIHVRPWWVRTVDKPTTAIDWDVMQRFDAFNGHTLSHGWFKFVSQSERERLLTINAETERVRILSHQPGYTLEDHSLYRAFESIRGMLPTSFLGPRNAPTPEERGVPRYRGTPEDAAQVVKAALRQMGAGSIGILHLDDKTRKLIYSVDVDGKRIEFEDVAEAYETASKRVIPTRCEWAIVYTVQMSLEGISRSPTVISSTSASSGYLRGMLIQPLLQDFLRSLGYQGLGELRRNALGIAPAMGVLAGLGELSRQNRLLTPEYGPLVRVFIAITDLPMTADRPIDAGIVNFCRICKKCAEACPPAALSFDTEPGWQTAGGWNNPGHQAWFEDGVRCRSYWLEEAGKDCAICFAVCPFSKMDKDFMNKYIKMTVANLAGSATVIRSLDDAFGYGVQKDPATWWDLDLPEYGIDTAQGKHD